jgi:hypothetical protein
MENESTDVKGENKEQDKANAQATETPPVKGEKMIPKTRFDEVNQQKKEALEALQSVADELIKDLPEDLRDLVPDLSPAQKISWIRNAQKKGIFGKPSTEGLDTKRPGGKVPQDLTGLNSHALIKMGYKTTK